MEAGSGGDSAFVSYRSSSVEARSNPTVRQAKTAAKTAQYSGIGPDSCEVSTRSPRFRPIRKITMIAFEQSLRIVRQEVDFAAQFFGSARVETIDARVAVETHVNSFKQLVRAVAGGREQPSVIRRETSDQAVDRMIHANRARVGVLKSDVARQID